MSLALCQACGKPESEHLDSRPAGDPAPRCACTGLKAFFRPRVEREKPASLSERERDAHSPWCAIFTVASGVCNCGVALPSPSRAAATVAPLLGIDEAEGRAQQIELMLDAPPAGLMVVAAALAHRGRLDLADLVLALVAKKLDPYLDHREPLTGDSKP